MQRFELEKKITSCYVNKSLIEQMEYYILNKIPDIIKFPPEKISSRYKLTIIDTAGEETLTSINEYYASLFPNDIKRLSINVIRSFNDLYFNIAIVFNGQYSKITIAFEGSNPREAVIGILDGINRIMLSNLNTNKLFHPPTWVYAFLAAPLLSWFVSDIAYSLGRKDPLIKTSTCITGLFILILLFLIFLGKMKPYIVFDTNLNMQYSKRFDWFFWGFIGFLLFGTVFVFLRKQILGF